MWLREMASNDVLWIGIIIMFLAQFLKPFTYWLRGQEFDWHHISATGGMPSSHTALTSAVATGVGLQAGEQARAINVIIAEVLSGHPLERIRFREVLGHSRREVTVGIFFGIALMMLWKLVVQPLFIR